jgi:hypothetical protein
VPSRKGKRCCNETNSPPNLLITPEFLYSAVAAPTPPTRDRTNDPPRPVLEQIRQVSDRVAVREEVPAAGTVAVVVEPGAED